MNNRQQMWLTRMDDGSTDPRYVLSFLLPEIKRIKGTSRNGVYPTYGDPIWIPNLCGIVTEMAGGKVKELKPCESTRLTITVE